MMNLTLRQLRYFDALAQHLHFGRAADACAVTQPALSMQIKELEQSLGVPLFERHARQVRLTGLGEAFALRVRDILRSVDDLKNLARASHDGMAGRLRIGVIPTIAPYLLPKIVTTLMAVYPSLDLTLREARTQTLIDELAEGRLDAAVVALPVSEPSLAEIALFSEEFVLVRPAVDAAKPIPKPEALRDMRLLLLEEGHCFRDQALAFCKMSTAAPWDLLNGNSLSTLVQMVGAGIGITLIPEMAIPLETRSATVAVARFPAPKPSRTIGMTWRRQNPMAQQFHRIAAIVRQSADLAHAVPLQVTTK